ncbi:amino acid ABC transporter permease [Chelatococcus composti]|jgi:polar amino acid transport system permease protein|uniref:Polar amino acid transport system permease protein n=1 Tax=Chelatococcus composti TaxID=1743235 RepID=A0A841KBC3_9HYPH|nr:amino acid ABC transporter permease [Chelatococcus composti]MBB6168702.1 polar amino acid transport system permease protein [Chelatococcus composti]MBS7737310.1 amino acid ABC transporter permease [Chelatococcus composti]PZN40647.1 MAG: amino acid ABC transporter permease [Pseudomonadota bacterium]GGG42167.1 ABC transporter permease [Chelatococcus composti]
MRTFNEADLLSLFSALRWTVVLVALALACGGPLALMLALMRSSRIAPLRWLAAGILQLVQGVPLLGLLMFFYFGMPVFLGVEVPALVAVGVAFTAYTAVFLGEIWRGGIQAVKQTQWEAAACLGLTRWQQFRYVIAPQAFRMALPPTVGFLVQLIKNTSLASVVGFVELARAGQMASAATFQPLLVYSVVAAIYFALCLPLTVWSRKLEARLNGAR